MIDFACEVNRTKKPFPLQVSLQDYQNGRGGVYIGGQHSIYYLNLANRATAAKIKKLKSSQAAVRNMMRRI